ncbi:MAG: sensor histidine kinase [Roseburia sp.]
MKKKINKKFMLIAAIAIVATAVCSIILSFQVLERQIFDDLKANAHVISMMDLTKLPQQEDAPDFRLEADGLRITWVKPDGSVRYDSMEDETAMGNHGSRPEVVKAFHDGEGTDIRKSATSSRQTFYYALRLSDGSVLRVSKESAGLYHLLFNMVGITILIAGAVFVMCAVFSRRLTGRLMAPVERLAANLTMVDEDSVYEEMRPFVATIKQQHMDILDHAKMRQEFTANVSHELKTPLTAISGYAELISSGMTGEEDTRHFADEIHRNAERLQTLINDIIKLSELDNDNLKLEFETVNLYELAQNAVSMLELTAEKNGVSICLAGEPVALSASKTLVEELIYNLCSNAVRYNKRGGSVTVTVGTEEGHPALTVADTGIGIPADQQERVFERFYRVDKSRSKQTGGTGLGLAIVKHIVAQHDAKLTLKSEEGKGTEIKVVF